MRGSPPWVASSTCSSREGILGDTMRTPSWIAFSRPRCWWHVPTRARSSSSKRGTLTAHGTVASANSPGERTSIQRRRGLLRASSTDISRIISRASDRIALRMRLLLCIIITHAGGSPKIGGSGLRKAGKETAGGDGRRLETVFFLFPVPQTDRPRENRRPEPPEKGRKTEKPRVRRQPWHVSA